MAAAPPWPVVLDERWQCAQTPTLPFLGFHEHTALRPIGEVTIQIPSSPFFSLFLADGVTPGARARRDGGQRAPVFGKWDKGAQRERRVQYACDGVAVREAQRCTFAKDDGLVLETRCWAAAHPGGARAAASAAELGAVEEVEDDAWDLCERWVVSENKGYLRASTTVTAWASSEAGRVRWRAWAGVLELRTYAAAVWAMASDSLFRSQTTPATDGDAGPFAARAPPDHVRSAVLEAPPAVAARRRSEAARTATEAAAAAGMGRLRAPWAVAAPATAVQLPRRGVTVCALGETYEVTIQTKVIGLQFSAVRGCVVDGVDGYASRDPPPTPGSRVGGRPRLRRRRGAPEPRGAAVETGLRRPRARLARGRAVIVGRRVAGAGRGRRTRPC